MASTYQTADLGSDVHAVSSPYTWYTRSEGAAWGQMSAGDDITHFLADDDLSFNGSGIQSHCIYDGTTGEWIDLDLCGFSVPSGATIVGVEVRVKGIIQWGNANTPTESELIIQLRGASGLLGNSDTKGEGGFWGLDDTVEVTNHDYAPVDYRWGSSTSLWGATLTPAIVNDDDFGIRLTMGTYAGAATRPYLTLIQVIVYYTTGDTTLTAIGCFLLGDDWDSPGNIIIGGSEAKATAYLSALIATCFTQTLKSLIPIGATFKGFWAIVSGTVYWEGDEPDSLDLIVRFRDNEGYVGKTLIAGKVTYRCPTCGWMWGGNPGATCPQCGETTEAHPLWTTGEGSEQTFSYIFGGSNFGAVSAGARAYILPLNRCVVTDPGFGIEFMVQGSGAIDINNTIGIDSVEVTAFYEE